MHDLTNSVFSFVMDDIRVQGRIDDIRFAHAELIDDDADGIAEFQEKQVAHLKELMLDVAEENFYDMRAELLQMLEEDVFEEFFNEKLFM